MESLNNFEEITIERAENISALSDFYCGIKAMDEFIHNRVNGLESYLKNHLTNLWIVYLKGVPIAFFSLSKGTVILNNYDFNMLKSTEIEISEEIFEHKTNYPSIEIDYLGVRGDFQRSGIGEFLISLISKQAKEDNLSATLFLSLDAYHTNSYSSVNFYKKNGFYINEYGLLQNQYKERYGERPLTVRMFKPLIFN